MSIGEIAELPRASSANIRRRIVVKSEPVTVTTQEAVDGYCEKAMRIASVEQIELGNIVELSITGQVVRWARQSNLSGGLSLRKADGWNLKNHSHLTVARHVHEKTHPSMMVVTIREGEERGICSAALRLVSSALVTDAPTFGLARVSERMKSVRLHHRMSILRLCMVLV